MENPNRKTIRAVTWFFIGFAIGALTVAIEYSTIRDRSQNAEAFQLRTIADLKRQIHDEEMYYMKEMAVYRHAAGFRLRVPSPAEVSAGLTCADESFATSGNPGFSLRSWKPRDDGRCYVEDAIQGGIQ